MVNVGVDLPLVSVIIPCRGPGAYLEESLRELGRLGYPRLEVIVIPDFPIEGGIAGATAIASGPVGPAVKRDVGAAAARGEILAFIDDDAYPRQDWLARAVEIFKDPKVAAVGGPGVTPPTDGLRAQASGWVYGCILGGAGFRYRVLPMPARWVDDYPSMNFLVRRDAFERAGGFDTHFYPGEDTKLCLAIVENGGLIRYDPEVVVYHHRRDVFLPHLRQIAQYAIHRGHFARVYPKTSLRPWYLLPTLLVAGLAAGPILAAQAGWLARFYRLGAGAYLAALALTAIEVTYKSRNPLVGLLASAGVASTHFVYGVLFVKGFLARRLKR